MLAATLLNLPKVRFVRDHAQNPLPEREHVNEFVTRQEAITADIAGQEENKTTEESRRRRKRKQAQAAALLWFLED